VTLNSYNIRRRHALQLLAGLSGGLLLHACGQTSNNTPATGRSTGSANSSANTDKNTTTITMGGPGWIGLSPLYIAQEKGFFAAEGITVDFRPFPSNGEAMPAFVSSKIDGMSAVSSEVILLNSQGKDFKVVLAEDNSLGADGILARNSIKSIADFRGKKIAVDTSGVSYFFLLQVMKEAGLSKDDITPVNIDPQGAATAYQAGNVDIAVTYSPSLQLANEATPDGRIIYDTSKMPTAITDMYIFSSDFIEANPKAIQGFVNAVFKGLQLLNEKPDEGLAIAAKTLEVEPKALEADLKGVKLADRAANQKMLGDPSSDVYVMNSLKELANFLVDQGDIKAVPADLNKIIDPQFVKAATA
jgi:NitT/TauT family transport system substrate-binding protein